MFHHVEELQFNARVSGPDVRFAKLLFEQFVRPNGKLKGSRLRVLKEQLNRL